MNGRVNKFLLAEDKFMPEMHLGQPGFTYSACGPFTKNKERIQKFKEAGDSRYFYQNELDKAKFFDKKNSGSGIKNEIISNKELAEELHKPIIRKFNKRKVQLPFIDNIWGADLVDIQLISKFN